MVDSFSRSAFFKPFMVILTVFVSVLVVLWSASVLYLLIFIINNIFPGWLSGGEHSTNAVHNGVELVFFMVNIIVLPVGLLALFIAKGHARELENSRQGTVYMNIVDKWNSAEMVRSRKLILDLCNAAGGGGQQEAAHVCQILLEIGDQKLLIKERNYLNILNFFEDVGLLCRKAYIREDDVLNFIGGNIVYIIDRLMPYIAEVRKKAQETDSDEDADDPLALYANALYLYKAAQRHRPRFHTEPLPSELPTGPGHR